MFVFFFFFKAEDGIRELVRSRGLGEVYKRQPYAYRAASLRSRAAPGKVKGVPTRRTLAGSPEGGLVRPVTPGT